MSLRDLTSPSHTRREFLRVGLGGSLGVWLTSSLPSEIAADETNDRAMILLWMNGGPSQTDTFDPKPGHPNAGTFSANRTSADGIQICEHLPKLSRQMHHIGLIRSMTSTEGSHERGRYMLHTGYRPLGSASTHPTFGSVVSAEIGNPAGSIPNFVSLNLPSIGPGLLGMTHAAFHVPTPEESVPNAETPEGVDDARFNRRLKMLKSLETSFIRSGRGSESADHLEVYQKGVRLMKSPSLKAFDVNGENPKVIDAYGRNAFGHGCLLARRLVEVGVKCVEVTLSGWDTHLNNFNKNKELMGIVDPAMATLIRELNERQLLEKTLVVWMGEFGRTPGINVLGGRDHWPKGWSVAMAGAGIRGGQVVGKTSPDGTEVVQRPVTVPELFATFCKALEIDPKKKNYSSNGRPISIVDKGEPVHELFG